MGHANFIFHCLIAARAAGRKYARVQSSRCKRSPRPPPLHRRRTAFFSPPARLVSLLIAVRFANLVDPGSGGLAGC